MIQYRDTINHKLYKQKHINVKYVTSFSTLKHCILSTRKARNYYG